MLKITLHREMNSYEIVVLQRFKTGLVQFIDDLIRWMPGDDELLATRILIQDQLPIEEVMKKFIEHVKPFVPQIKEKDEDFFLKDPKIFGTVKDQSRVLSLKKLWTNPKFTRDDKEKTWAWMGFFVKCIELYEEHHT